MSQSTVRALNGVNLDLVQGQIYSLLGHNGAGKTTTIKCLTGLTPFDVGTVEYFVGADGEALKLEAGTARGSQVELIRRNLGVCTQENILFNELTPREHLSMFARIKGISSKSVPSHVEALLKQIVLPPGDDDRPVHHFSGGNKRKVALGVALVGNPKVLFLDEPTAGMDPKSRRMVWDMLQRCKQGRCIVLTTHFMDEAEVLGDRIGIIQGGKVAYSGTNLFLKKRFESTYNLTVTTFKKVVDKSCHSLTLLQSVIPDTKQIRDVGNEEVYALPSAATGDFPRALKLLSTHKSQLGVKDMSIARASLEDIFLLVGQEKTMPNDEEINISRNEVKKQRQLSINVSDDGSSEKHRNNLRAILSMALIRVKTLIRTPNALVMTVLLPLFFVTLAFYSPSLFDKPAYVETEPLLMHSDALSVVDQPKCAFESVLNGNTADAATQRTSQQYRDRISTRSWNSLGAMDDYLADSLESPDKYVNRSCGGIILGWKGSDGDHPSTLFNAKAGVVLAVNSSLVMSAPVMLNMYGNALLATVSGQSERVGNITTYNHPFPYRPTSIVSISGLFLPMFLGMGFMSVGLGAVALVSDRESKRRHLLRLLGVPDSVYILSNITFDIIVIGVPLIILSTALIFIMDVKSFQGDRFIGWILICATSPIAATIFAYIVSHIFKTQSQAARLWPMLLPAMTIMPFVVAYVLNQPNSSDSNRNLSKLIRQIFSVIPSFAFQNSIQVMLELDKVENLTYQRMFAWDDGLGTVFLFNILNIIFGWTFLMHLERERTDSVSFLSRFMPKEKVGVESNYVSDSYYLMQNASSPTRSLSTDRHMSLESGFSQGIQSSPVKETRCPSGLLTHSLTKKFSQLPDRPAAVDNLILGIPPQELFVLLGPNGAGKSTTMSMLTTEQVPTSGTGSISGFDIISDKCQIRAGSILGYCPQFDALHECITVHEHLWLFATLHGFEQKYLNAIVSAACQSVGIEAHRHKRVMELSGGNKRKLSVALSMIGRPSVLILDEPSTGVDVGARRIIWETLKKFKEETQSAILLSTHSMEEAVALHDRIGILVAGKLKATGTAAHLQQEYGKGLAVEVNAWPGSGDLALAAMRKRIPNTVLVEKFGDHMKLKLPAMELSEAFEAMESITSDTASVGTSSFPVQYYAIANVTLEDVFLEFCKQK